MTPPAPVIHAVRRGRAPNCSATGSVVGLALVTATAAAVVVNAFAERFARWLEGDDRPPDPDAGDGEAPDPTPQDPSPDDPAAPRVRLEPDGGVIAWHDPPALLFVDGPTAQAAIARGAPLVGGAPAPAGALTAPTEVHVAVTERCPVRCTACYLDAGPDRADPPREALDDDLETLARLGVLEIALGGGEVLLRPDLPALAHRIRDLGMVPNLTTSGLGLTRPLAHALATVAGQVNVSLDGPPEAYRRTRGWDGAGTALRAVDLLVEAGVRVGVNTVLTRASFDALDELADLLVAHGVVEWQWLRLKPAGRGAEAYEDLVLTPDQQTALWPRLLALEARTGLTFRVDCALVPFVAAHGPDPQALQRLGVAGCPGGHSLLSRRADGAWAPCSFAHDDAAQGAPGDHWQADPTLVTWRARADAPPEPCASCAFRASCRGGCRVVAAHLTGDPLAPDPECPRVRAAAEAG
ncbi:MAG: radical SAM protein [Alphaproteobacteria bacterium]|nr:radical SAM protein [Alphaproteobacteria bacterium]